MSEHTLAILVKALGTAQASKAIKGVDSSIGHLASTAGKGVRTAAGNIGKIGLVAAGGLAVAIHSGLDSLATLESAVTSVDGAIKQMGITGRVSGGQIAGWANEIEASIGAAFDDKDITAATATLIRFGHLAPRNIRPAMVVMTDLAAKTGSVDSAASLLAKALADPTKAAGKLARSGVILTKEEQKTIAAMVKHGKVGRAQAFILDRLAKTTKGAAAATQGPYQRALSVLGDTWEDVTRALAQGFMPVIEKVAGFLNTELAKPSTMKMIQDFGSSLAGAFSQLLEIVPSIPWDSIKSAMQVAGEGAKAALGFFNGLPDWVKTAVITGWGLNKLTGGAVSDIVGTLAGGLVKGVLGMTAGVVNINAGVVNGGGGIPGIGGKGGGVAGKVAGAGGALSALGKAGVYIGGVAAIGYAVSQIYKGPKAMNAFTPTIGSTFAPPKVTKDAFSGIDWKTVAAGMGAGKPTVDATNKVKDAAQQGLNNLGGIERTGNATIAGAVGLTASRIVGAIQNARDIINVTVPVYVTAGAVAKAGNTQVHYGKPNGSAGGGNAHGGGGNIPT